MSTHARYIIVLDRMDDDDNCGPDGHEPRSDQEGMEQVAAELQEAMEQTGEPAGFFNVIARMQADRDEEGANVSTLDPAALRAKLLKDNTGVSLYPYKWSMAYLQDARDNEAIDKDTPDKVIQREAFRLEEHLFQTANSFVDNEFNEKPGPESDRHGTLNPNWNPDAGERRFVIHVRGHEPNEEADWKYKLDVYDNKYLDSDGLPIFAIAGGCSWSEAFARAHDFVVTAMQTDHCIF